MFNKFNKKKKIVFYFYLINQTNYVGKIHQVSFVISTRFSVWYRAIIICAYLSEYMSISTFNQLWWVQTMKIIWIPTCPCPKDIDWNFLPSNPLSSANFSRLIVGSAPGERIKIRGEQLLESTKLLARSNGGGSTNFFPSFSFTKSVMAGMICK